MHEAKFRKKGKIGIIYSKFFRHCCSSTTINLQWQEREQRQDIIAKIEMSKEHYGNRFYDDTLGKIRDIFLIFHDRIYSECYSEAA